MDPLQIQNQQQMPMQIPMWQTMPGQMMQGQPVSYQMPQQQYQTPAQNMMYPQVQAVAPQEDGIFDKILKGIVNFIAKSSGQSDPIVGQATNAQTPQVIQQPVMPVQPVISVQPVQSSQQNSDFFGQLGSSLGGVVQWVQNIASNAVSTAVEGTQNYIVQPVQQTIPHDMQQLVQKNYQIEPTMQPAQPIPQPVMQATVQPIPQPVMQATVQPIPQPVQIQPQA